MPSGPVLALDFSTSVASVAVLDNGQVLFSVENAKMRTHVSHCQKLIRDCLSRADISMTDLKAVSTNIGPGSYTGLRVALSAAKAIAYVKDIPIHAYSGIRILRSVADDSYGVAIDAHKGYNYYHNPGALRDQALEIKRLHNDDIWQLGQPLVSNNEALIAPLLEQYSTRPAIHVPLRADHQAPLEPTSDEFFHRLSAISSLGPLYVLPPNITIRKKPLIS